MATLAWSGMGYGLGSATLPRKYDQGCLEFVHVKWAALDNKTERSNCDFSPTRSHRISVWISSPQITESTAYTTKLISRAWLPDEKRLLHAKITIVGFSLLIHSQIINDQLTIANLLFIAILIIDYVINLFMHHLHHLLD